MAQPASSQPHIPLIYVVYFSWIDPVLSLLGVYGGLFHPELLLTSYIPATIPNPAPLHTILQQRQIPNPDAVVNPAHALIFNQLGGLFLVPFVLGTFLLRYTRDITIWSLYLGSILIVDVIILISTAVAYAHQGRLNPLTWRKEDSFSVLITLTCTILRAAFILGIGLEKKRKAN